MESFLEKLKILPAEVTDSYGNVYSLDITKGADYNDWIVSYINEYAYTTLVDKNDRHNKCSHFAIEHSIDDDFENTSVYKIQGDETYMLFWNSSNGEEPEYRYVLPLDT